MIAGLLALSLALGQVADPARSVEARHLGILGGWSAANLAGGATGLVLADDPRWRAFHGTNLAWNTVNAGIVAAGGVGLARRKHGFETPEALERHQRGLQRALVVNLALDVLYVGTGVALWAVGGRAGEVDLRGMGQSLTLQGGFLLGFDAAFLASHRRRTGPFGR